MATDQPEALSEIKIKGVPTKMKQQIKTAADENGQTISGFLKAEIRKVLLNHAPEQNRLQRLSDD